MSTKEIGGHGGLRSSSRQKSMTPSYADVKNPSMVDLVEQEEALVCTGFTMSAAQQAYQRDANRQDLSENEIMFYKDATPKAEHYMAFRIELPSSAARALGPHAEVPLEVELVAMVPQVGGGPPTSGQFETVADQSTLKGVGAAQTALGDRPLVGAALAYRIELGSYRQGDRRFAILARVAPKAAADSPVLQALAPCLTPAVYVASKVKRHRAVDLAHDEPPPLKRHHDHLEVAPVVPPPATDATVHELQDRVDRLERLLRAKVIPALTRIEARLVQGAAPSPPSQESAAASGGPFVVGDVDPLFSGVPPLILERGNSEQIINSFYAPDYSSQQPSDEVGGFWADSMTTMGNGLQEAMSSNSAAANVA
mmetsp:Transcript_3925/g.12049  ORF Transcript_3925/g.12049 Transcript_3925/m.12049 type:complete len:368 (-) Transcript_3925:200-1303(-)|eukprot:CAMPEP_0197387732 /NCGR_PEP_ID=MMETSP1165-20131217/687_1 /TAXON_ID=284809 /ORGANISM="Chrysocystis fragilis, Strain CCMP3189" /LENGTH=367 /DNA_ID=CAMNT_0042913065 /DNA_START=114 /DNA_END=1217 /DNA_ORIENTATION=+